MRFLFRSSEAARRGDLGLVLTGGGARAAYQVGLLRWIARRFPELRLPILTGVSAGAVNAAFLASRTEGFQAAVESLTDLWRELSPEQVLRADVRSLASNVARWGGRLLSGGIRGDGGVRGLVDTTPLHEFLTAQMGEPDGRIRGVEENLRRGTLRAVAISTTSYTTGQSVVWVDGSEIRLWTRPQRRAHWTRLRIDHVMASSALPLFFPAVQIGDEWYGDGGIGLVAPLSPALHLGADRILAISTRNPKSQAEADQPVVEGYPPPAQVIGTLMNALFLDVIDQDALRLERLNRLLEKLPRSRRESLRVIGLKVLRPSRDLSRLARDFEPRLPRPLRFMSRGLGTREARGSDMLSMIMFQPDYVRCLMEIGEEDAEAQAEELEAFLRG